MDPKICTVKNCYNGMIIQYDGQIEYCKNCNCQAYIQKENITN
jgi:hypothetical protein